MIAPTQDSFPVSLGIIDGLIVFAALGALIVFVLWSALKRRRSRREALREGLIAWFGLAVVGLGAASLMAMRVSWQLDRLVEFGRAGSLVAPAAVPIAIFAIGGAAALVAAIVSLVRGRVVGGSNPVSPRDR